MIPTFPKFIKLDISHKKIIERRTSKYLPYCDFNFLTLWSYDIKDEIDISVLNNNLVVKFTDSITTKNHYSFFGKNKFEKTSIALLEYCKKKKILPKLKFIPEVFINKDYRYSKILISEDRHNFDYIYSLDKLSKLPGKKLAKKRQLLNKFIRKYPKYSIKKINLNEAIIKKDILKLFNIWETLKKRRHIDTENELRALTKLLAHPNEFHLLSLAIFTNNQLVGFSIVEKVHRNYAIGHFAKTNPSYDGINEILYKNTADLLLQNNCKYLNLEQDMGLENLRYAKMLWQPEFFLKKYDVSLK